MERFSQVYLEKGDTKNDSERLRVRIQRHFDERRFRSRGLDDDFIRKVTLTCGIRVSKSAGLQGIKIWEFFEQAELRDFLDGITIVHKLLVDARRHVEASGWRKDIETVLREENTAYTIDQSGMIHFYVDEEFEAVRISSIELLNQTGLTGAIRHFDEGLRYLDGANPSTRKAIVGVFEAVEAVAKELTGQARLDKKVVSNHLGPLLKGATECVNEHRSLQKLLTSFGEWVDACHFYRHTQKEDQAAPPSIDTAVMYMQAGSAYLRRLCKLYIENNVKQ